MNYSHIHILHLNSNENSYNVIHAFLLLNSNVDLHKIIHVFQLMKTYIMKPKNATFIAHAVKC